MSKILVALILKLLVPYFAVGLFWCIFKNAWLAILTYHVQVLFWARGSWPSFRLPEKKQMMFLALPALAAGPVLYFLLPYIKHTPLVAWLDEYRLSGVSLAVMVPYFGVVHPVFEQLHWSKLREKTTLSHFVFAGYHMIVLYSLLTIPWLMVCFIVLTSVSFAWQQMSDKSGSLALSLMSHIMSDMGIVIVALMVCSK